MKVFSGSLCQSFDSMKRSGTAILAIWAASTSAALYSDRAVAVTSEAREVMTQCRTLSFDQAGFDECLAVIERESELTMSGIETDWLALAEESAAAAAPSTGDSGVPELDQLHAMATQYREYRDQLCEFGAKELDDVSAVPAAQACRISMNRDRTALLQQLYIERQARRQRGTFYRGYLLMTDDAGLFQSCELRQDWTIEASDEQREQIRDRYTEVTSEVLELVYVELRGRLVLPDAADPVMQVNHLNLLRPVLDSDCTNAPAAPATETVSGEQGEAEPDASGSDANAVDSTDNTPAAAAEATIDSYGAAGFMYGYFGDWTSVCAADAPQVCQAQVQHSLSTEGDWRLLIDRSTDLNWRVRLMATTSSHTVAGAIQLSINGAAATTVPVPSQQLLLDRPHTLVQGDPALDLINRMKSGGTVEMNWNSTLQDNISLIFSLNGAALALNYFDNRGN
jgi:hypothetical protein